MALIYDVLFDSQTRVLSLLDKAGNVISSCEVPSKELVDDITKPLTFKAIQDGSTVKLTKNGYPTGSFQTSRDGGNTWVNYTIDTTITLNTGDEVSFRAKADRASAQDASKYFHFKMTGKIEAWHNVMSLYRTNDFATYNTVVNSSFLLLFDGCTSLAKAPVLPATTLAEHCYLGMFYGCTSLAKAPVLPATTLAEDCYRTMFYGCTSLAKAPVLPATTLDYNCYKYMFEGCTSLKEVRISATKTATDALTDWLKNVSATGDFYCDPNATIFPTDSASGIPKGWNRVPAVDDPNKPLMLRAIEDNSSVALEKVGTLSNTYLTSTDGTNWTDYTLGTQIILNKGESVYFRCSNHPTIQSSSNYVYFKMTGKIEAWHNAYSMIRPSFTSTGESVGNYGMVRLFKDCTSLTKAPLLLNALSPYCYSSMFYGCSALTQAPALPATTLAEYCYSSMFYGCNSLTQAPALPATTLAEYCYQSMFNGCNSLTQAPLLPATTLAEYCYAWMFYGCSALTQAPELPATTLSYYCYAYMFYGCNSLTQAPELPATTLAEYCCTYMFSGCTSLTQASLLPATTLAKSCYNYMFRRCTSLTQAPALPATTLAESCYQGMFIECSALTQAPALPATTLAESCYQGMFKGCSVLTQAPDLPVTTLADGCYIEMFRGCSVLTQAPDLPATTLAKYCYMSMFRECTSLTQAPLLPATRLTNQCYQSMFSSCSNLKEVRVSATTTVNGALKDWLSGVSATGDFYCDPDATIFPTNSASGIPQNWNRHALADYPVTP